MKENEMELIASFINEALENKENEEKLNEIFFNYGEEKMSKVISRKIIEERKKQGKTVIAVMHNLSNAIRFADNIIIMENGKAVFYGSKNDCLNENAFEKYFKVKRYLCESENGAKIFFSK